MGAPCHCPQNVDGHKAPLNGPPGSVRLPSKGKAVNTKTQGEAPRFLKQMSVMVRPDDWKVIRVAAAHRKIPMTQLLLELLEPGLAELRAMPMADADDYE